MANADWFRYDTHISANEYVMECTIYIYICMRVCACVCVLCVCLTDIKRQTYNDDFVSATAHTEVSVFDNRFFFLLLLLLWFGFVLFT